MASKAPADMHKTSARVTRAAIRVGRILMSRSRLRRGERALKRIVHLVFMCVLMCKVLVHVLAPVVVRRNLDR